MVDFDPRFEIMPGAKAKSMKVVHADPYDAVPGQPVAKACEGPLLAQTSSSPRLRLVRNKLLSGRDSSAIHTPGFDPNDECNWSSTWPRPLKNVTYIERFSRDVDRRGKRIASISSDFSDVR